MPIDRYFVVHPNQMAGYRATLVPDNDILPLDTFPNALCIFLDDIKAILCVRLDGPTIEELQAQTDCLNPLSIEAVESLDIYGSYIGVTIQDVYDKYPELEGQEQIGIDEEGEPVMKDIVSKTVWA